MFKRILVPLDGRPESRAALQAAQTMARATGASMLLLHVLESPANASAHAMERMLARVGEGLAAGDLRVEWAVRRGHAAEVILEQVRDQGADLVVMRTRGRAGLQRAILGSVAEAFLSRSDVPMLTLRAGGREMNQIAQVLVPVDATPGGALAIASGMGLSKVSGARMQLVEVVVPLASRALAPSDYHPAWDDEALNAAETYVDGMVTRLRAAGVTADGAARLAPDIPGGIIQAAAEHASDLIIMSTHALTGLQRAVLGSVADAVVRTAPAPVLLLRRSDHEH